MKLLAFSAMAFVVATINFAAAKATSPREVDGPVQVRTSPTEKDKPAPGAMSPVKAKQAKAKAAREKLNKTATVRSPQATRRNGRKSAALERTAKLDKQRKVEKPKGRKRSGRQRIIIDPTTTASIVAGAAAGKKIADAVKADASQSVASGLQYATIVAQHAASNGVPLALAHAVIRVESNYRPDVRGSAGEIGLMQIKPATARMMGYRGSSQGLFDPATNIQYGMKYLGMAHKLGGGATCATILRYNAGHAARRMNPVSTAYCSKVKRELGA